MLVPSQNYFFIYFIRIDEKLTHESRQLYSFQSWWCASLLGWWRSSVFRTEQFIKIHWIMAGSWISTQIFKYRRLDQAVIIWSKVLLKHTWTFFVKKLFQLFRFIVWLVEWTCLSWISLYCFYCFLNNSVTRLLEIREFQGIVKIFDLLLVNYLEELFPAVNGR